MLGTATYIHIVDHQAGCNPTESLRRRSHVREGLAFAQDEVRQRLRSGYKHADHMDGWTILKRGNDIYRIRLEERDPFREGENGR